LEQIALKKKNKRKKAIKAKKEEFVKEKSFLNKENDTIL
jgi:hypothetical protein|tara:strand:+ start:271 stop:387 length:117 start_codon:yes stop_codon:yes gene_type:complete